MPGNEYQIIVRLPEADGYLHTDYTFAEAVQEAIKEGLRDRFVETDWISIEKVPPPRDRADLPVGTRVLVTPFRNEGQPYAARVCGYDIHRSKYRLDRESFYHPGEYYTGGLDWAFVGQVEPHPDNTGTTEETP